MDFPTIQERFHDELEYDRATKIVNDTNKKEDKLKMVDYNTEVERLESYKPEDDSQFWKPKAGQYKVKALTELENAEPFQESGKPDKPQVKVQLVIDGAEVTWTMSIGKTPASSYGQLCKLAKAKGGTLKDQEFMIVVTNDGTKNTYTLVL